MSLTLKIKKLHPDAKIPSFQFPSDAGLDICTVETVTIKKGERKKIATGLAMEFPPGYVALVWDKSGLAANHGLTNLAGVIDAGYRGEYFITIQNLGEADYTFEKGHKIAQILIQKVEQPKIEVVEELSSSERGAAGHGSSGK